MNRVRSSKEWYDAVATTAALFLPNIALCYQCVDAGVEMGVIDVCDAKEIKERIDALMEAK